MSEVIELVGKEGQLLKVRVPDGTSKQQAQVLAIQKGAIDPEFLGQESADAAQGVGAFESAMIAAGGFVTTIDDRLAALTGNDTAKQRIQEQDELLAPLREDHPIATAVGEAIPAALIPGGKFAQAAVGAAEGALLDPENPFIAAATGAAGGFIGGAIGDRLSQAIAKRGSSAAARLAARGIRTTAAQRGDPVASVVEQGLEALPGANIIAAAPIRQQEKMLGKGASQVMGIEGPLTKEGFAEAFGRAGKDLDIVQDAIPDTVLPLELEKMLDGLNVLDVDERSLIDISGILDGEGLMRIRSALSESMADAALDGKTAVARQHRAALNQLEDLIEKQLPDEMVDLWTDARARWRFGLAAKKTNAINAQGGVNAKTMNNALNTIYPNFRIGTDLPGRAKEFGQLLDALNELAPRKASSQTAERLAGAAMLTGGVPLAASQPGILAIPALAALSVSSRPSTRAGALVGKAALRSAEDELRERFSSQPADLTDQ